MEPAGDRGRVARFESWSATPPHVRGVLHRPAHPAAALVLAHGAGSTCEAPLLVTLAEAFAARSVAVLRCDLPFRQARASGPPRPGDAAADREGLRRAAAAVRAEVGRAPWLGGHSYGGRQATHLAAEDLGVATALLLLSYPLHSPRRPDALRTDHFSRLRTPAFFVHGTADPFGSPAELGAARALVPAATELLVVDGAGHDLGRARRGAPTVRTLAERIADAFLEWAARLDGGGGGDRAVI